MTRVLCGHFCYKILHHISSSIHTLTFKMAQVAEADSTTTETGQPKRGIYFAI